MVADTPTVPNGSTGNTINFTYTAAFGGIFGGVVTLTVPPGWSQPDDSNPAAEGFTTADIPGGCGCPPIVFVDGRTIFVFPLFLGIPTDPETTLDITYGDTSGGGPGATAPTTAGRQHWPTKEASNCGCSSVLRRLASAPAITVLSQDGSGTMKASASTVSANSRNTIKFKYAAAPGGMDNGTVTLDVATDWSSPSTNPTADGYVTASAGTVSTAGQTITVSNLTLFGSSVTITYGSKAGGGAGALAPATTGAHTWFARQRSSPGVTPPTPLFTSPQITVYAADGSGTLTTPTTDVSDSSTGNTIEFTYTADAGGIQNGVVVLTVPPGWSAPSTSSAADGYTTSSAGNVAVSGRKITVSGLTLAGGGTFVLTYGASSGATAPATVGPQTWTTKERSTNTGVLTPLTAGSPVITVN